METLVIIVHVIAAIAIIGLVLLQQGKGAETGAAFGSGASQTVFGSGGSGNFLTRTTSLAAVVFFATSLVLAVFAKQYSVGASDGAAAHCKSGFAAGRNAVRYTSGFSA